MSINTVHKGDDGDDDDDKLKILHISLKQFMDISDNDE